MANSVPHTIVFADVQALVGLHAQSETTRGKKAVHQPSALQPGSSHSRPIQTARKFVGNRVAPKSSKMPRAQPIQTSRKSAGKRPATNSSKMRKKEPNSELKSSSRGLLSSIHQLEVKMEVSISREATSPGRSIAGASYGEPYSDPTIGYPSYGKPKERDFTHNGKTGYYTAGRNQSASNHKSPGYHDIGRGDQRYSGRDEPIYTYGEYESSHSVSTGYAQVDDEIEDAGYPGRDDIGYRQSGYVDYSGQNLHDYDDYGDDGYNDYDPYDDCW